MRGCWIGFLGLACGGLLPAPVHAEDFERALSAYRASLKRPSLHKRTLGRERLAATEDPRALRMLAESYGAAEKPRDQVQYLIVTIATDRFAEPQHLPVYAEWRQKHGQTKDAWLWYQSLILQLEGAGPAELTRIVRTQTHTCLRAAALEALRFGQHPVLLELIPEVARKLPQKPVARAVMLESLAAALWSLRERKAAPEFRAPAEAVIGHMDEEATLERTRIVMARYLSKIFGVKYTWRSGRRWLAELKTVQGAKREGRERYVTFAGIEATGDRICYAIDMSDSMLEPLKARDLKGLPEGGPFAGPRAAAARQEKESKSEEWKKAFKKLRWDKIKNRFDAARELLKASLLLLPEDKRYVVIGFGDAAATIRSTRGLTQATLGNVKRTLHELDSIRPGPKARGRPHGTLRGKTNMHGALHRAFKLRGKGMVGPYEYVHAATWIGGCDTIFLLSDGAPTWDDWASPDSKDPEDRAGDPELGAWQDDSSNLIFPGPYRRTGFLIEDVRRLNLFRKVEIHCVGMGEASMHLLRSLASIGRGHALKLGGR
ncbi:MAG: hypothetical protein ACE5JG_04390 [Planctomycetota bacterium]